MDITASPSVPSAKPSRVEVEPNLLRVIESAGAPARVPKGVAPPTTLPGIVGAAARIRGLIGVARHGVAFLTSMRDRYGDIYRAPFIGADRVVVWDADEIHKILKNEDNVWSTAMGWDLLMFRGIDPRGGNAGTLLSVDFDTHRAGRKLVQPAFTLKAIEGYLQTARPRFDHAISEWTARGRVDFKPAVRALLASVATEIFTGLRSSEEVEAVDRALSDFWHGMMAVSRNPWLSPTFRRARRGFATLMKTFLALVPERRRTGGDDVFSHMCQASASNSTDGDLGDEAMVRTFVTIMFGAFDTTSAAMTSMAYLLAKHPEWQDRLRAESKRVPSLDDAASLRNLKELDWAWKETLRLMPVTSFVPRRALRDVELAGHKLAAGTLVTPMASAIGRHPRWWKNPDTFDPERFSPDRAEDKQHPIIFVPFGAGAHACVGMQLATMEMKLFWHKLLTSTKRFSLSPDYAATHTHTPMGSVSGQVPLSLET
jgi:cytochrome P450